MKKTLIFVSLIVCIAVNGQKNSINNQDEWTKNFVIEDGNIYWRKNFSTELSFKEVATNVKISGFFDKPDVDEPLISGQLLPFKADFKEVGYNYMNAPFLISNTNVTGGASIMYGTSNCTVKVKRINLTYVEDGVLWKKGEINELKEAVLKRDGTVRNNLKNVLIILDYNFNKMFQSLF